MWKDWAEWHNWQKSQGNSHKQTINQLRTPEGRRIFWRRPKFYIDSMYENNDFAYNMSKTFFQVERKFFQGREALLLVTDLVARWLGMQTSHQRQDRYMGMYSERLLVRFLLDILKSSLVGLDNSAWEFVWFWERLSNKRCLVKRKGTQQHAGADKGRLKEYIIYPSAVKINCKSSCEVAYANFGQTFFATVREY